MTEVPAEVCDTCGETVVDSETTSRVLELAQDARYHWNRDSENLKGDGVVIGGEPGKDGGIIRVDFDTPTLPADRVVTSGQ